MSNQESSRTPPPERPRRAGRYALVAAAVVVTAVIAVFLMRNREEIRPGRGGERPSDQSSEQLETLRSAIAATENLETVPADRLWNTLFIQLPGDVSVAENRALNRVLTVDELSSRATNASLDADQQKAARSKLPDAINAARTSIGDYAKISGASVMSLWMRTRIDLNEAALLPASMTRSLRREIFDRLVEAINSDGVKSPQSVMLAGSLIRVMDELEDPIDGLPADLLKIAAATIGSISNQHPDNLFLALRAARLNIADQQPQSIIFIKRTGELARAIQPSLSRQTKAIGLTPEELLGEITAAVEAAKWSQAENRMLLWFNVLNSTEIVKTDRRRATPHPLDQLSFDALRRLSADAVRRQPIERGTSQISFADSTIDATDVRLVLPVDFDVDLDPDLVTVSGDSNVTLWRNGGGAFIADAAAELDLIPIGMIAADLFMVDSSDPSRSQVERGDNGEDQAAASRHTTIPSLVFFGDDGLRVVTVDGRESTADTDRLKTVDTDTGLGDISGAVQVVAGDLEGDGDLDLVVATQSAGVRIFVNRGNRTFFEVLEHTGGFDVDDPVAAMAIVDLDRDLDLDIVTVHPKSGRIGWLENLLHLQFRARSLDDVPVIPGATSISVADVDGNVSWDLVVSGEKETAIVFSQTADAGVWTVDQVEQTDTGLGSVVIADFDNDSWTELLGNAADKEILSRLGPWGLDAWQAVEPELDRSTHVADFNSDGRVDIAGIKGGKPHVAINETHPSGHHLQVRFKGIDDNNANSGRVNHFAIGSVLELRFGPHYRSQIITSPTTHFGLDGYDTADSVRVILPNGLTQTIRSPSVDTLVEEEQTLKGSCPYLYAWDGEKYAFVTDCLWAAPLGLQVARGVVAKDRPWEYLKVDGKHVKPRGDRYDFRITEELWEVAYFDKVALQAVDHPDNVQVWTNEKVGPGELATPTIFAFRDNELRGVKHAVDTRQRNVTEQVQQRDGQFVQGFDRRIRQGLCPPHWIDLDFGELPAADANSRPSVFLVLTGWILPTDTSLNIQIDQNPEIPAIEFPSVWVPDSNLPDGWRKAIPFMGFPGGKTKTIVVDVTDVIVADDPRLRVRTSAQIYWDSAQLAVQTEPAPYTTHSLDLMSAELDYHGFSGRIRDGIKRPETYDYQNASLTPRWPPLKGDLSRFGDCGKLVRDWDDSMAVISSGDEIRLEFSVPGEEVPSGWQRDFVLHCVGWDKDADLNTLTGQMTGPLPYREMASYPPTAASMAQSEATRERNRVHLQRQQSFRAFWHRGRGWQRPSDHGTHLGAVADDQAR